MIEMLKFPVLLAIAAAALVLGVASVSAHAEYERSTPGRNEILTQSPARVDVYFAQEVRKVEGANFVRVVNDADDQVSTGDGVVDDDDRTHIYAEIANELPAGRYIVNWQTLSDEDGDDDSGSFCFYVNTTPTAEQLAECGQFDEDQGAPTTTPGTGSPGPTSAQEPPTETPPPPTAAPTAMPTPQVTPSATEDDGDGGSSAGLIIGVIIGVVAVVGAIGGGVIWLRRRQG
jgi:methionine-rich copper-binding protein CopC